MAVPTNHSKTRVLHLYRQILRTGQSWEGPREEKAYITQEAKDRFHERKDVTEDSLIEKMVKEGEERLDYATHYQIAYPRLRHKSQFPKRYFLQSPTEDAVGSDGSASSGSSKLEAAIQRRKAVHYHLPPNPKTLSNGPNKQSS